MRSTESIYWLGWVIELSRIVLLTDASSDDQALKHVAQVAWAQLPFSQKIKRFRRVATRYDKLAETFFGFVYLAMTVVALRA